MCTSKSRQLSAIREWFLEMGKITAEVSKAREAGVTVRTW